MKDAVNGYSGYSVPIMMVHLVVVQDPELGTIAATVDETGAILATDADRPWKTTNLAPYIEAADLAAKELAHLWHEANPSVVADWSHVLSEWAREGDL